MAKLSLVDLTSLANAGSAVNTLNENFAAIEAALENTVSRDGTTPNEMLADLDMNSNSLLNVADPVAETDGVNLRSIRPLVADAVSDIVEEALTAGHVVEKYTATASQTTFPLGGSPVALSNTYVFVDGLAQVPGEDYTLVDGDTIEFAVGLSVNDEVLIRYLEVLPISVGDAAAVTYTHEDSEAYERTVHDVLGERVSVLNFIPAALHVDIKAGTNTDNLSPYIQAAMDSFGGLGGVLHFPVGVYHARALVHPSGLVLEGDSKYLSILKAHSTKAVTEAIIANETNNLLTRVDENLTLLRMGFDGDDQGNAADPQDLFKGMVNYGCVLNVRVEDCLFTNYGYIGIAISHSKNIEVDSCEFSFLGYDGTGTPVTNGGPGLYISSFSGAALYTEEANVHDCYFHDCPWSPIHFSAISGSVHSNRFIDCQESGIYLASRTSAEAAVFLCKNIACYGNIIDNITRRGISCSGIECARIQECSIYGNHFSNVGGDGVTLTDCVRTSVYNNKIKNAAQIIATRGGISLFAVASAPTTGTRNRIINNHVWDDQGSPTTNHGVGYLGGGGTAPTNVTVEDNELEGPFVKGAYDMTTSNFFKSSTLVRQRNMGVTDSKVQLGSFVVPVTAAPVTTTVATNFPPSRVEFDIVWNGTGEETRISHSIVLRDGTSQLLSQTQDSAAVQAGFTATRAAQIKDIAGTLLIDGVTGANTMTESGSPVVYGFQIVFNTTEASSNPTCYWRAYP